MPEYHAIQRDRTHALALADGGDALVDALISRTGCAPLEAAGRGAVFRFSYAPGEGVLREYRRGGVMRFFSHQYFLLDNRPLREFKVHAFLAGNCFPVPPLLGIAWEWRGPFLCGCIATGRVGGLPLHRALARHEEPGKMARICGEYIAAMHRLGVWHADLQVSNILLDGDAFCFIDFDNASGPRPLPRIACARNLLRLRRSFEKHGLPETWFAALLEGYDGERIPRWLDALYRLRGFGRNDKKNVAVENRQ